MVKHGEGIEHASGALARAREALSELRYRRRGLMVSLIFIVGLLIALAMKIRNLPPPKEVA